MTEYREKPSFKIVFWSCLFGCMLLRGQVNKDIIRVQYHIKTIAFYNLENLFDTINQPHVYDDDRTPKGKDQWTSKKFHHKINQLARVMGSLGLELNHEKVSASGQKGNQNETRTQPKIKPLSYTSGADIIGVCEAENIAVLEALVRHPILRPFGYGIIHFDSPDERGIDVALLYKKRGFIPASFNTHSLYLYNEMQMRDYTRDQLVVMGYLDGEPIWLILNHWPSRSGGEARSKPHRLAAALLNVRIIDSIRNLDPKAKSLVWETLMTTLLTRVLSSCYKQNHGLATAATEHFITLWKPYSKKALGHWLTGINGVSLINFTSVKRSLKRKKEFIAF